MPRDTTVARSFALDTARHLSVRGMYPRWLALPDRWASWWPAAVIGGLRLVRRYRPAAIWSTYPIATAHLIGWALHRLSGLPWVADFRDPMTEADYPADAATGRTYRWIEERVMTHASRMIFTTRSTRAMYVTRYPRRLASEFLFIPNGYDEADFQDLQVPESVRRRPSEPLRLLHAGQIYSEERDPGPLFTALVRLKREGRISPATLTVDLRASSSEAYFAAMIERTGLQDIVHLLPALSYRKALQDCADSDALLLLQGASCNRQIPAEAYEYLRVGKPILALTGADGETAGLLKETGGATIVDMLDADALHRTVPDFLDLVRTGEHATADRTAIGRYTREHATLELASCLDELVGQGSECANAVHFPRR